MILGPMKYVVAALFLPALAIVGYLLWPENAPTQVACTEEAKICLDGTAVGRTGPNCEFAQCPTVSLPATTTPLVLPPATASSTDITLAVGQTTKVDRLFITLNRFIEDNRCPISVECVQAGSVTVNATFARGVHTETDNLVSDAAARAFENYKISIVSVSPTRRGAEIIPSESYRIVFRVEETTFQ
jgi:hypothetical protein